jgi:hypothetical protein
MQQAGYHHANMLAAQLRIDMDNRNNEMLAMVQTQLMEPEESQVPYNPSANIATQDTVQLEMLKLLRAIQQDLKTPRTHSSSQNQNHQPQSGTTRKINRRRLRMMLHSRGVLLINIVGPMAAAITRRQIAPARQKAIRRTPLLMHVKGVRMLFSPQSNDGGRRVIVKTIK